MVLTELSGKRFSVLGEMVIFNPEMGTIVIRSAHPPVAVVPPMFSTFQLMVSESPGFTSVTDG